MEHARVYVFARNNTRIQFITKFFYILYEELDIQSRADARDRGIDRKICAVIEKSFEIERSDEIEENIFPSYETM